MEACKAMGATHTVNHKNDLEEQIKALNLDVPIKYVTVAELKQDH